MSILSWHSSCCGSHLFYACALVRVWDLVFPDARRPQRRSWGCPSTPPLTVSFISCDGTSVNSPSSSSVDMSRNITLVYLYVFFYCHLT
jgi:hypothetical protein